MGNRATTTATNGVGAAKRWCSALRSRRRRGKREAAVAMVEIEVEVEVANRWNPAQERRRQQPDSEAAMATSEVESKIQAVYRWSPAQERSRNQADQVAATGSTESKIQVATRWEWDQSGLVRTADLLGDHMTMELRAAIQTKKRRAAIRRYARALSKKLKKYEDEPRLLIKLADTGRVVVELERAIRIVLGLLRRQTSEEVASWLEHLQDERQQRVQLYESLLVDQKRLRAEFGDEQSHEEVQTLLKYGIEKYGGVLTPGELSVMASVFKASVELSDIVVMRTPDWFATTLGGGDITISALAGGEERCLREASMWSKVRHPNVRKFYGACHVGREAYLIHEYSEKRSYPGWSGLVDYAQGLLFLHEQGIVHKKLSRGDIMYSRWSGFCLSGLGLTYAPPPKEVLDDSPHDSLPVTNLADVTAPDQLPSKARDVKAFSLCCVNRSGWSELEDFPSTKPYYLDDDEWRFLQSMNCDNPADRPSMLDVVHEMEVFAKRKRHYRRYSRCSNDPEDLLETVENLHNYEVVTLGQTLAEILKGAARICNEADEEIAVVHWPVCGRLLDIYEQLEKCSSPLPLQAVEGFGEIVQRFFLTLERKTSNRFSYGFGSSQSVAGSLCAARTVAGRNYGLHHHIDHFLREHASLGLDASDVLHKWRPSWEAVQHKQRQKLERVIANPSTVLEGVETEEERSETLALLQYECEKAGLSSIGQLLPTLPQWYIAPHRVQLGRHLADGSFASVFEGTYEETPVVVKVLSSNLTRKTRREFIQEASVWFSLEHRHVLKLYGACHEGRPFFVCEPAMRGTVIEASRGVNDAWYYLREAGEGLQYLHDHGIVHADLKGNNILVSTTFSAKVADFGLSFSANNPISTAAANNRALGAFRWKAPEVLRGEKATFASDIYSLGMCIVEAVTGELPWGEKIPDGAVKNHVINRQLPQRPKSFSDGQWDLVTRMCCYDPNDRLTIGAVQAILQHWRHQ